MFGFKSKKKLLNEIDMNNIPEHIGIIMDGKISQVRPATAKELETNIPPHVLANSSAGIWMRADFQATTAGTELFATQYCRYCKVISPTSLSEKIKDNLESGLQLY